MILRVRFQSAIALDMLDSDACKRFSFKKKTFWVNPRGYSLADKMPTSCCDHRTSTVCRAGTEIKEKSLSNHLAMALSPVCLGQNNEGNMFGDAMDV